MGPLSWSILEFEKFGFSRGRKLEYLEKNSHGARQERQQQTQPTHDTRPELTPGHTGGRQVLSPLCWPSLLVTNPAEIKLGSCMCTIGIDVRVTIDILDPYP